MHPGVKMILWRLGQNLWLQKQKQKKTRCKIEIIFTANKTILKMGNLCAYWKNVK